MSNLTYYHPNGKGTGAAVAFRLDENAVVVTMAPQLPDCTRVDLRFDWDAPIFARLDLDGLCQALQVLRGETESIADGKGLYQKTTASVVRVFFRHLVDPVTGYDLEIINADASGNNEHRARILFSPAEALGLSIAFEDAVRRMAWCDDVKTAAPNVLAGLFN